MSSRLLSCERHKKQVARAFSSRRPSPRDGGACFQARYRQASEHKRGADSHALSATRVCIALTSHSRCPAVAFFSRVFLLLSVDQLKLSNKLTMSNKLPRILLLLLLFHSRYKLGSHSPLFFFNFLVVSSVLLSFFFALYFLCLSSRSLRSTVMGRSDGALRSVTMMANWNS